MPPILRAIPVCGGSSKVIPSKSAGVSPEGTNLLQGSELQVINKSLTTHAIYPFLRIRLWQHMFNMMSDMQ